MKGRDDNHVNIGSFATVTNNTIYRTSGRLDDVSNYTYPDGQMRTAYYRTRYVGILVQRNNVVIEKNDLVGTGGNAGASINIGNGHTITIEENNVTNAIGPYGINICLGGYEKDHDYYVENNSINGVDNSTDLANGTFHGNAMGINLEFRGISVGDVNILSVTNNDIGNITDAGQTGDTAYGIWLRDSASTGYDISTLTIPMSGANKNSVLGAEQNFVNDL